MYSNKVINRCHSIASLGSAFQWVVCTSGVCTQEAGAYVSYVSLVVNPGTLQ